MGDVPSSNHPRLTPWERQFLDSLKDHKRGELSPKQLVILNRILTKIEPPKVTIASFGDAAAKTEAVYPAVASAGDIDSLIKGLPQVKKLV